MWRVAIFLLIALMTGVLSPAQDFSSRGDEKSAGDPDTTAASTAQSTAVAVDTEGVKIDARRGSLILVPLPVASPALGTGLVPVVGYIFQLKKSDQVSPPSVIGAVGLATNNGTRVLGFGADLFLKQNTYHLTAIYANGNLNYDLYGIGLRAGNAGSKLPLEQDGQVLLLQGMKKIGWKFFIGPRFIYGRSDITVRPNSGSTVPIPADTGLETSLVSLGFRVQRDTRSNRFYPTNGTLFDFTADFFSIGLGSKYSFQSYRGTFNKYWGLGKKHVFAYNLYLCGTGGVPPFYGNCIYGANNELRGYTAGRYLDRYMYATQLEYRLILPWRLGLVGFGGFGEVIPGVDQLLRANEFLPAGGGGVRFLLSKKHHVNLRFDVAHGKNGHTWAMSVGEAF